MQKTKKQFTPQFKANVVLDILSQTGTLNEISSKHGVHITQLGIWKKEFIKNASLAFGQNKNKQVDDKDKIIENLYKKIGQYDVEIDWLKKKSGYNT